MTGQEARPARTDVQNAIADLARLRSSDPAARHAMHAIRLTRLMLEEFWLDTPAADRAGT